MITAFSILAYYAAGLQFMLWVDRKWHAYEADPWLVVVGAIVWLPVVAIQTVVAIKERVRIYRRGY